jgi:glycosyltransferase involved in cell wall biosynthesis
MIRQATRIVARKGIELAIDFVKALDSPEQRKKLMEQGLYNGKTFSEDSRIVLVLAGYARDDMTGSYVKRLMEKAKRDGVDMIHIEDMVGHEREIRNGDKNYSLWDSYVFADFVTYPSLWEGWGNQFLEAIRAKLPILIYEYPVYREDISPKGFKVVSLGSETIDADDLGLVKVSKEKITQAVDSAIKLLTDTEFRNKMVEFNFDLANKYYSMDALRKYLGDLMRA